MKTIKKIKVSFELLNKTTHEDIMREAIRDLIKDMPFLELLKAFNVRFIDPRSEEAIEKMTNPDLQSEEIALYQELVERQICIYEASLHDIPYPDFVDLSIKLPTTNDKKEGQFLVRAIKNISGHKFKLGSVLVCGSSRFKVEPSRRFICKDSKGNYDVLYEEEFEILDLK